MARKPVTRSLPSLNVLCPRGSVFACTDNRVEKIASSLKQVIAKVRRNRPVTFYSMRDVARHFGVALKTVGEAYRRIEAEGLLTRMRGSKTMVRGRKVRPLHPVRGVVGLPVYLPGFMIGIVWRNLFMRLEEELRRRQFVADFIFYREQDEASPDLAERLLAHRLDTVFWWAPSRVLVQTIHRLVDGGIQVVVVSNGQGHFPREQYVLNLDRALHQGLESWQRSGVRSVVILQSTLTAHRQESALIVKILRLLRMEVSIATLAEHQVEACVDKLVRKRKTGVVLLVHAWYETLCCKFPQTMEKLIRNCRTLLVQEPVYQPYFQGRNVFVDSVGLDCEKIARRVAHDIATQKTATNSRLATFYTQWSPQIDLGSISRRI